MVYVDVGIGMIGEFRSSGQRLVASVNNLSAVLEQLNGPEIGLDGRVARAAAI